MSKIITFARMPARLKAAVAEAFFLSAWYRIQIVKRPFKNIANRLGRENTEVITDYTKKQLDAALTVKRAVAITASHTPWRCLCLEQAFTAKSMLKRRGVPCTVYLGVRKSPDGEMLAHAWTRCGDFFVTGAPGHSLFTVTGKFA